MMGELLDLFLSHLLGLCLLFYLNTNILQGNILLLNGMAASLQNHPRSAKKQPVSVVLGTESMDHVIGKNKLQ